MHRSNFTPVDLKVVGGPKDGDIEPSWEELDLLDGADVIISYSCCDDPDCFLINEVAYRYDWKWGELIYKGHETL